MQEDLYGTPNNGVHSIETGPRNNYGQIEEAELLKAMELQEKQINRK